MTPDIDPAEFELVTFTGVFDDTDGTQVAVLTADGLVEADIDEPPPHVQLGDAVTLHAVRMNANGWFKALALLPLSRDT